MSSAKFNKQRVIPPGDLNFNARTVAATATVSTVFGTNGYTQLSFGLSVTRVAASVWTVILEWSPNYTGPGTAIWIREQMGTPSAGTTTLADNTYSFTTSATDTLSIDVPINYPNMRFTVNNTGGTTDTATAFVILGTN